VFGTGTKKQPRNFFSAAVSNFEKNKGSEISRFVIQIESSFFKLPGANKIVELKKPDT
jgi:hypothetical protein